MATRSPSPFPVALRLSIDDLGEFRLQIGEELTVEPGVFEGAMAPARASLTRSLHGGARWHLAQGSEDRELLPGDTWGAAGRKYTLLAPDPGSPMHCWKPMGFEAPGVIWMAPGEWEGFSIGRLGTDWSLGGLPHPVELTALDGGLRIACEGGVRKAVGDGEFGGAEPYQLADWTCTQRQSFWNAARPGSGPPLFVTLDPLG
ncbi:MAG: hypothetical protein KDB61_04520 [Planctomycetes bacterium]|nr:hypothetical protein [Planctomycetota bacterium]